METTRKQEWFDDDSFWHDFYPFMFPEKRIAEAVPQAAKVLALTRPQGKSVLDLCCGPGRFSVPLARKGFRVTGVDRTAYLLRKARSRARAARVNVEWIRQDMRDFVRPDSYALALSMFTSFGYFDDKQEDLRVLQNIFTSLQPGGVCLIDVMGKERLAKIFQSPVTTIHPDGSVFIDSHEVIDDWTRTRNEWRLIRNGKVKTFRFHLTIYSGLELRERLERAGFAEVRLFGNLDGAPYDRNAERLIATARKPSLTGSKLAAEKKSIRRGRSSRNAHA